MKDNKLIYNYSDTLEISEFCKDVYRNFGVNYPKFFKMDELSKLCFLASEILLKDYPDKERMKNDKTGVILCNASSSIFTDAKYQIGIQSFDDFTPTPALFVYTLPNIAVGEICIRNGFKGNNIFFVMDKFDRDFMFDYLNIQFSKQALDYAVCGWCEFSSNTIDVQMFLVKKI
jgi:hypothetical protein